MVPALRPGTWEAEGGESEFEAILGYTEKPHLRKRHKSGSSSNVGLVR